jgi:hypothetical protein
MNLGADTKKYAFYILDMGNISRAISICYVLSNALDAIFLAVLSHILENYARLENQFFKWPLRNTARFPLLDALLMSQGFDVPVNRGPIPPLFLKGPPFDVRAPSHLNNS